MASYVVAVDATISTEVSTARSSEAVLSTNLSSEVSAMGSAVTATYATISGNIATHATAIDTKEQHEGVGRHVRVDFTSETSFSVAAVDLPSNFEPGNGMVQVFQLVSAGIYRHLVAPSTYNASTGVMSFDFGSTAKSGFVVFYSFAGDEASATEVQLNADMYISGFSGSGLSDENGGSSSIVLTFTGVGSEANAKKHFNLLTPFSLQSTHYGATFFNEAVAGSSSTPLGVSWNSGYTELTLSWTNTQTPSDSAGYQYLTLHWGANSSTSAPLRVYIKIDATTKVLQTDSGLGLVGLTGDMHVHPPYALSSNGISAYSGTNTWATGSGKTFRGPSFSFDAIDAVKLSNNWNNNGISVETMNQGYVTMTVSGNDKYMKAQYAPTVGASHRLYNEIYGSRLQLTVSNATKYYVRFLAPANTTTFKLGYYGKDQSGSIKNTTASQPDADTNVNFYFIGGAEVTSVAHLQGGNAVHDDAKYDMKITIAMDDKVAGNMTMTVFRSDATLSSPSWTEVDRAYFGGHNIS